MLTPSEDTFKEARVTPAWLRFILFCQKEIPHGEVKVQIVSGEPTKLIDFKRAIRFDKEGSVPSNLSA